MFFLQLFGNFLAESAKEKKKDLEENAKMSKNAQFRTIQPSPSILSFVEENVICMSEAL